MRELASNLEANESSVLLRKKLILHIPSCILLRAVVRVREVPEDFVDQVRLSPKMTNVNLNFDDVLAPLSESFLRIYNIERSEHLHN